VCNIEMNLKQLRCEDVDWNYVALDKVQLRAFVRSVMNLLVELNT
jgi:hypothetical protein